jgi:hypothetical protein
VSYDLHLLDCAPGDDPEKLHDRLEQFAAEGAQSPPDPAIDARNRRLADTLLAAHPAYSEYSGDDGIELTDPDGLQIYLSEHEATITFPYWDSLDAEALMERVQAAARVIGSETGWRVFDPQLDKVVDPAQDATAMTETFDYGRASLRKAVASDEAVATRPWWKRLFGG